jgi:2Fe-2S ferredoxin
MPHVTYIEASGEAATHDLPDGWTLVQGALTRGIAGIVAECGGSCTCATCHCYVDEAWADRVPAPQENELAMLDFVAAERKPNSRLACQIRVTPELDGLVVRLPETQE